MCDPETSALRDPSVARSIHFAAKRLTYQDGWTSADLPDLEQELHIHLWKSSGRFNPDRGSWRTFASRVVGNKARTMLRDSKAVKRSISRLSQSLNEEVDDEEGDAVELQDVLDLEQYLAMTRGPTRTEPELVALKCDIDRVLATLSPEERVVCQLTASMAKDEVAQALGLHRATLHRIVQRLRQAFQAAGLEEYLE